MKRQLLVIVLITAFTSTIIVSLALAACYSGAVPSSVSCCNPDTADRQIKTTQDQAGQSGANTFCIGVCTNDTYTCNFQLSASSGCVSSGSYSNVWKWESNKAEHQCINAAKYYWYSYDLVEPTSQGETVKYIVDNMNCQPQM
jgi:hypothetical protein